MSIECSRLSAACLAVLTATTVVSGSLAERAQFEAYVAYAPLMSVLIYPIVVHWAVNGWLTTFAPKCIYLDFAGGSTVHLLGASLALLSTLGSCSIHCSPAGCGAAI